MWRWASASTGATAAASYLAAFSGKLTGTSLYLHHFVICTDTQLGVHGITNAAFYIIASPVGSYYPNGLAPVRIAIERDDVRGVRGGTGYAKCGGNYAAAARQRNRSRHGLLRFTYF